MINVFSDSDSIFTIIRYRKILKTRSQHQQQRGLSQDIGLLVIVSKIEGIIGNILR